VDPINAAPAEAEYSTALDGRNGAKTQIRGSSLLLAGRLLSMVINTTVQVLIVRSLAKTQYGAFAYALSFVSLGETAVTMGLDRAITRFIPIYDERREYGKLLGALALVLGTILGLGLVTVLLVIGLQGVIAGRLIEDRQAVTLLVILIALAPIQALDSLALSMFAVFARPAAIFVRRYVLAPGLRLVVVLLLIFRNSDVTFLATGYVAAGAAGLVIYGFVLLRAMRARGLLALTNVGGIQLPAREIFAFTLPLLTSDLVYAAMNVSDAVMLGYFKDTAEVAAFRAVQPTAKLNQLVMSSFAFLFMPLAARMFARGEREDLNMLYWRTAMWLAVLSFPVFLLTFSLAQPLTLTLYGQDYAKSGVYLALLSFGTYIQAASGFNGLTLKVVGRLRYIVMINLFATGANVLVNLALIPWLGALGAAIGTSSAYVLHNVLKQIGLRRGTGVALFPRDGLKVYTAIAIGAGGLLAVQTLLSPPLWTGVALGASVSLVVLWISRPVLHAADVFPELRRFRFLRALLIAPRL
jgi:O-antigen/teichoic acid export membrane protein